MSNLFAYIQVTRLKDGAFVLGFQVCHVNGDAAGVTQFIRAIAELARGEAHPSISPVWEREIFKARDPPRVRHDVYPAYDPSSPSKTVLGDHDDVDDPMLSTPTEDMVGQYLCFGPKELAALRGHVNMAQPCTTFELLAAFLWRCRTAALGYRPGQRVRLVLRVDARGNDRCKLDPPIPRGYYGNAVLRPMAEAGVDDLCSRPLEHAVGLVRKAKLCATEEHFRSMVDMMSSARTHERLVASRDKIDKNDPWERTHRVTLQRKYFTRLTLLCDVRHLGATLHCVTPSCSTPHPPTTWQRGPIPQAM